MPVPVIPGIKPMSNWQKFVIVSGAIAIFIVALGTAYITTCGSA